MDSALRQGSRLSTTSRRAQGLGTIEQPTAPRHCGPDPSTDAAFGRLAARLESALEPLTGELLARLRRSLTGPPSEPGPIEAARLILAEQLRAFAHRELPADLGDLAAEAARLAADLDLCLELHRAAHIVLWEAWFELVETASLDLSRRRELLRRGSDFLFAYAGRLDDLAVGFFRNRLEPGAERRRFRAVADLLAGDPRAAGGVDFDLARYHLAVIAWGEDPAAAVRALAARLARPLLLVTPPEPSDAAWAWISGHRRLEPHQEPQLREFDPGRARIAIGLEAAGESGFRAGHRQALRARRLIDDGDSPVIHFADVAVEALAAENEEDARAFVANELRGIEDESARSRLLRETLEAYFAAEYNAACAGAALGVHQQTVANRLRAAEQRLGRDSIGMRRVELELALRLRTRFAAS
jgi:hypothetical protein